MPVLNVACPICTETFKNSDDVYSTSCGHLFHFACMNDWQSRATSCPQCRFYNPTTHKLYLSFDDFDENPTEINDLKIKLQSSTEKIAQLYDQIREGDVNFLHLQEQYTTSEELIRELEQRNRQSNDSETNFLSLQGQYTVTEDLNKELQESVQLLSIEIECKTKELQLKTMEVATLKASLDAVESQTCETILNEKIKVLEQKLKHLSTEFEKEITSSTQLSIDKMKLQSYIERMKLEANINEYDKNEKINNSILGKSLSNSTISNSSVMLGITPNPKPFISHLKVKKEINSTVRSLNGRQNLDIDRDNISSVVIKDYPLNQITYPLENIIIALATKMDLLISKEDLSKVNIMERNKQRPLPKKVTLYVQFKSLDLKIKFLSNKNRLKNDSTTESFIIKEYMDDVTFSVFTYANKKLRGNGFQYIVCKNNQVFAKKHFREPKGIRIYSRNQVDDMLKSNRTSSSSEEPTVPLRLYEDKVDECFYKI